MQERLVEIAKELDELAKKRKFYVRISADYHGKEPEIHIVSYIHKDYDCLKPYTTINLEPIQENNSGVTLISDGFYFRNVEGETEND